MAATYVNLEPSIFMIPTLFIKGDKMSSLAETKEEVDFLLEDIEYYEYLMRCAMEDYQRVKLLKLNSERQLQEKSWATVDGIAQQRN